MVQSERVVMMLVADAKRKPSSKGACARNGPLCRDDPAALVLITACRKPPVKQKERAGIGHRASSTVRGSFFLAPFSVSNARGAPLFFCCCSKPVVLSCVDGKKKKGTTPSTHKKSQTSPKEKWNPRRRLLLRWLLRAIRAQALLTAFRRPPCIKPLWIMRHARTHQIMSLL